MAQNQVLGQLRTTHIQIAVFQADILVHVTMLIQHKRQRFGTVEQLALSNLNLHLTGLHVGINGTFGTGNHRAFNGKHELAAYPFCHLMGRRVDLRVKHHLCDPLPIPQVDEDQTAVITAAQGPPHQHHFTANILGRQLSTVVRTFPVSQCIHRFYPPVNLLFDQSSDTAPADVKLVPRAVNRPILDKSKPFQLIPADKLPEPAVI